MSRRTRTWREHTLGPLAADELDALVRTGPTEKQELLLLWADAHHPVNPFTVAHIETLAVSPNPRVREMLLTSRLPLPGHVIDTAVTDPDPRIRGAIAISMRRLPDHAIQALAEDADPVVRLRVIHGLLSDAPTSVLTTLAADPVASNRVELARTLIGSPRTAPAVIMLAVDPAPAVRDAVVAGCGVARKRTRWPHEFTADGSPLWRRVVIAANATQARIIRAAANDPAPHVRAAVCHNPGIPGDLLLTLGSDQEPTVRAAVTARIAAAAAA